MSMNSLFVSDLDGTLLTDAAELSEWSRITLSRLLNEGLLFTVASARSVASIADILKGLTLPLPVIEFNGAFLSNASTGEHEVVNGIDSAIVEQVYEPIREYECSPFISTFTGETDRLYWSRVTNGGMQWYLDDRMARGDRRLQRVEDIRDAFFDQVVCVTIIGESALLERVESAVAEVTEGRVVTHLFENRYSPGWYWLTIHDWKATKDRAIQMVAQRYNFLNLPLVVFGDQINDIRMFEIADHAVAVENAVERVKNNASEVIGPNTADSVVKYIEKQWASG